MGNQKSWLNLLSLTNEYERKARLAPALTSFLPLLPFSMALGGSLTTWETALASTTGLFALGGLVLSHISSACGNNIQKRLWPDWPFDAPTNVRLTPDNPDTSPQQRTRWYKQIKLVTGLDLQSEVDGGDKSTIRATINDAVVRLRNHFKSGEHRKKHDQESIWYGYARNLAGMWPIWITFSVISFAGTWAMFLLGDGEMMWAVVSTISLALLVITAFLLPSYVRTRARYYTEVFFQILDEVAPLVGD